jgi:putative ABC transport system permease protein
MLKSYLKISFRNLWKYKGFSAINIAGLTIGMATCLLILQYISFKLAAIANPVESLRTE